MPDNVRRRYSVDQVAENGSRDEHEVRMKHAAQEKVEQVEAKEAKPANAAV